MVMMSGAAADACVVVVVRAGGVVQSERSQRGACGTLSSSLCSGNDSGCSSVKRSRTGVQWLPVKRYSDWKRPLTLPRRASRSCGV